jgi:cytoskeletal protein RodZ
MLYFKCKNKHAALKETIKNMQSLTTGKQRKKKRLAIVFSVLVATLMIGVGAVYALNQSSDQEKSIVSSKDNEDNKDDETIPSAGGPSQQDPSSNSVKTNQNADEEPTSDDKPIQITRTYVNSSKFEIRTLINDVTSAGTCTLTMTNDDASYSAAAGVQALPNSSTCKGFSVPLSSLDSGTWNVTVEYAGQSDSKEVVINV